MSVKIIECPRDAMQGIKHIISTEKKVEWMKLLLQCGFDTLDCGSFVSAEHVPQMADTAEVLQEIKTVKNNNKLLVIVANERGAKEAGKHHILDYVGFPFSVNDTFQRRNTNIGTKEAFLRLQKIHETVTENGQETVAYISMAFGNPYKDAYNPDDVLKWANKIAETGIKIISLADTTGSANIADIESLFSTINKQLPHVELGAHFHALPNRWMPKIEAAYASGCRRFDGAILGFGGCPMAADELTGNIPTERLVGWLNEKETTGINMDLLQQAVWKAPGIYG